jgi:hypothetical protein
MIEPFSTLCPVCFRPMRLASVMPRSRGLTAVETFDCRACGVGLTQAQSVAGAAPSLKSEPDYQALN